VLVLDFHVGDWSERFPKPGKLCKQLSQQDIAGVMPSGM
jgi:hypothetical protein